VYDDLSVLVVIDAAVAGDCVCAKMGIDSAELKKNNIVKIGK
jgi:hypothetical protein